MHQCIRRASTNRLALTPCVHSGLVFDPEKNGVTAIVTDISCAYLRLLLNMVDLAVHANPLSSSFKSVIVDSNPSSRLEASGLDIKSARPDAIS